MKKDLLNNLISMGMSDSQAEESLDYAIKKHKQEGDTYVDFDGDYPKFMVSIVILTLKPYLLEWIEENKPQAWFKPMFQ